jgi:polyisoprenoid-binding protein YceI
MTTNPTSTRILAGTWVVDTGATTAAFHGIGIGGAKVAGTIPVDAGRVEVGGSGRPLTVDAVLDAAGIASGNERRDKDLRSKRFLKVDTHPVIRFTGNHVTETAAGWTVEGTLGAAGAECAVSLDVRVLEGSPSDPAGHCRVMATGSLDRRALGIKVPSLMVRRQVRLEIDALLRRA